MPRVIDPGAGDAIGLDELVDAIEAARVHRLDEDGFAALGPLLARLGRNRTFLADLAIAELKNRCADQAAISSYGAQVLLLRPPGLDYVLRANFWPARADAALRASGPATFFYGMPHDHNFSFLTYGYIGPGYWSDYYDWPGDREELLPDDAVELRFVERSRLEPGKLMLYRAHRDVHTQLPPDSFSVSLNILRYDHAQRWRSQYRFDTAACTVAEGLTATPSEALAALAVQFGGGNGRDLAHELARGHPSARMRRTAIDALASDCRDAEARATLYEAAARGGDAAVARHARQRLDRLRFGR